MSGEWTDPDDAPDLTREWFDKAALKVAGEVVRPGRPKGSTTSDRQQVTLRLPRQVIEHFKSGGPGWQTRAIAVLEREAAKR